MQLLFSISFLVASLAFTLHGWTTLDVLDSLGRPGAGFFPVLIGVLLILTTGWNCIKELATRRALVNTDEQLGSDSQDEVHGLDTLVVATLIVVFLLSFKVLGSFLSMVLFCLLFLSWFNRQKLVFNLLYSLLLPAGVYLLFAVVLRAGLPAGILDFH